MIPAPESFKYDITKIKGREILVSQCKWSRDYLNTLKSELLCYLQEELRTNREIGVCFTKLLKSSHFFLKHEIFFGFKKYSNRKC